jgi:hypothetical protein
VDPLPLLEEYIATRFPERFYQLKIGIPWADLEKRVDVGAVMACCDDTPADPGEIYQYYMGVDTGKHLHVVILRRPLCKNSPLVVWSLRTYTSFEELEGCMREMDIRYCLIDGLPETHATRNFVRSFWRRAGMCFFNPGQRGEPLWDWRKQKVEVNRTEALDLSRRLIRDRLITITRGIANLEEFAQHLACDAKKIEENEETGERRARYVRTGANHYSMAFTYACLAAMRRRWEQL